MRVHIITWKIETGQVFVEYKVNEQLRRFRIQMDDFKNKILLDFASSGLNESNWDETLNGEDPKHSITEEMIISFIEWYHNI